jgi:ABC-type multidrug transport system ATPase subunit
MEEAEELCDRMAILDQGRIVAIDSPDEFKRKYAEPVLRVAVGGAEGPEIHWVRLDEEKDRALLADEVRKGRVLAIDSRRASFKEVFLKLTGREFH